METVINQDFSFCNHFISTNRHNPEIIDFVSDYTHNLDFLQVLLRNTQNGTMGLKQFETDN
jgi:hypothetical protein